MDNECKPQLDNIVAAIIKISGQLDVLVYAQKEQNKKLDATESLLSSIDNNIAGQCE